MTIMKIMKIIPTSVGAFALLSCGALAQQAQSGSITKVDEANCKITIQPTQVGAAASGAAEDFKLHDGLMFSVLQPGDRLVFTAAEVGGIKTITNLQKQ